MMLFDDLVDALGETYWYLLFGGLATLALIVVVAVGILPSGLLLGWDRSLLLGTQAASLIAIVFLCGAPANAVFTGLLRDRAYVAGDPLVDWIPWLPSGDWTISPVDGGRYLNGWSTGRLRLAWAVFALPTWLVAFRLFEWLGGQIGWWTS